MGRNSLLGISVVLSFRSGSPYPLLTDQLVPLVFVNLQAFQKAAENNHYIIVAGITLTTVVLAVPNILLALLHLVGGKRCMYHFISSDPCFVPDPNSKRCGIFSSNTTCAATPSDYYFCSDAEGWKNYLGILGAVGCFIVLLAFIESGIRGIINPKWWRHVHRPGMSFPLVPFMIGIGVFCGIASLALGYFACANIVTVRIADCRPQSLYNGTLGSPPQCETCLYMNSTSSKTGYFALWKKELGHDVNWLSVAALG